MGWPTWGSILVNLILSGSLAKFKPFNTIWKPTKPTKIKAFVCTLEHGSNNIKNAFLELTEQADTKGIQVILAEPFSGKVSRTKPFVNAVFQLYFM